MSLAYQIFHIYKKMAAKSLVSTDDEEFINMEVISFSNFLLSQTSSSPNPHNSSEFEFQMSTSSSSSSSHTESSSTSPADELFYKGKLLPLHLPPRFQMVQQILKNDQNHSLPVSLPSVNDDSISDRSQSINQKDYGFDKFYNTPLMASYSTPITVTPFRSYNNSSPYESFRVSDHDEILNPEEKGDDQNQEKKKKARKQHFSLVSKLRTWFGKVSCKYELAYVTKKVADEGSASKARESNLNCHHKQNGKVMGKKLYPFGGYITQRSDRDRFRSFSSRIVFRSIDIDKDPDGILVKGVDENGSNRIIRSSLDANKKLCFNGSSSFSGLPNKSYGSYQELDQVGNLIMGAIAYCKQSHQQCFN